MAQDFYDIRQVLDYLHEKIEDNKAQLGIRYVSYGDDDLLPEYPAVVLSAERPLHREEHATRQFRVTFGCDLWVFHANMAVSRQVRTKEDIELATGVRKLLHADKTLGGHIIFGFVETENPVRLRRADQPMAIATQLVWTGTNVVPYDLS